MTHDRETSGYNLMANPCGADVKLSSKWMRHFLSTCNKLQHFSFSYFVLRLSFLWNKGIFTLFVIFPRRSQSIALPRSRFRHPIPMYFSWSKRLTCAIWKLSLPPCTWIANVDRKYSNFPNRCSVLGSYVLYTSNPVRRDGVPSGSRPPSYFLSFPHTMPGLAGVGSHSCPACGTWRHGVW